MTEKKMFIFSKHPRSLYAVFFDGVLSNQGLPTSSVDRHIRGTRTHRKYGAESANDSFASSINREVNNRGIQHL